MTQHVQIAIIGGGIVGCSVLYHLSRLGQTDVVLIEKHDLASGSTWHAAGNVTFFGHYTSITRMYIESVQTYLDAEKESGINVSFHQTGSLRLATTREELMAYQELESLYRDLDVEFQVVGVPEINQLHPLLDTAGLIGAAYTPGDGHVDAAGASRAMARAAKNRGASIQRNSNVTGLKKLAGGNWQLSFEDGDIIADELVIANSFWAKELLKTVGINIPVYALEHQEIITDSIDEVASLKNELPTIRDPIAPANFRQEGSGLLCGVYEASPKPWAIHGIPKDYQGELFPVDFPRIEAHLERVAARIPVFASTGIKQIINGPICYTPDGLPLLGPVNNNPGLWLATGFCIGVGTGGGAGAYLSSWIVNGKEPYKLSAVNANRFGNEMNQTDAIKSILNTYSMGYSLPQGCGSSHH